jgi:hypothetical protein
MKFCNRVLGCLVGLAVLGGTACNGPLPQPKTYPAKGKVTVNKKPAAFLGIELLPEAGGVAPHSVTDKDGVFELRSFVSNGPPDGAPAGTYKVKLIPYNPVEMGGVPKGLKPTKLTPKQENSGVTVEVTSAGEDLNIEIP